jgi:wyosine [tRNA(Phe)-imidazoG37] synthetase (radical SAM superfamily)
VSTFLFDQLVFGPVHSRRLGISLGINLLPIESKYCNFNCIYCECGWNADKRPAGIHLPKRQDVYSALEKKLTEMQSSGELPDAITFAGNGEPTIHPDFPEIIDDTISLRNRYAPESKISVLTNATMLHRNRIVEALKKTDMPILKLDSAIESTIQLLNQPAGKISIKKLIDQLKSFEGACVIQTMFVHGMYEGKKVDNTTQEELDAWEKTILEIKPRQLMIYTIARDTPAQSLQKVSEQTLKDIALRMEKQGIPVHVST